MHINLLDDRLVSIILTERTDEASVTAPPGLSNGPTVVWVTGVRRPLYSIKSQQLGRTVLEQFVRTSQPSTGSTYFFAIDTSNPATSAYYGVLCCVLFCLTLLEFGRTWIESKPSFVMPKLKVERAGVVTSSTIHG